MYVFNTDRDLVAINGGGTADVVLISRDVGVEMNSSFGNCQLIDEVEGIESIVAAGAGGGSDPESADDYLDRLTTVISLLAPRPILPEDHAAMAATVPGVGRVTVANLLYPGTAQRDAGMAVGDFDMYQPQPAPAGTLHNEPRCTTVCITGAGGSEPTTDLMTDVYELLDANREVNFLNFVMKPLYVEVDVKAVVTPYPNRTKADAISTSTQMITDWLSPQGYGQLPGSDDSAWYGDTKLRLYEVVDFLNRGQATWYCEDVFMRLHGEPDSAWAAADLLIGTGLFPVPVLVDLDLT
jgi:uncharacterized phage protein gp47/JayE